MDFETIVLVLLALWVANCMTFVVYSIVTGTKPKFIVKWFDAWVGLFFCQKTDKVYLFILPMVGFVIDPNARRKR